MIRKLVAKSSLDDLLELNVCFYSDLCWFLPNFHSDQVTINVDRSKTH